MRGTGKVRTTDEDIHCGYCEGAIPRGSEFIYWHKVDAEKVLLVSPVHPDCWDKLKEIERVG